MRNLMLVAALASPLLAGCKQVTECDAQGGTTCHQPALSAAFDGQVADVVLGTVEVCIRSQCRTGTWDAPDPDAGGVRTGRFQGGTMTLSELSLSSVELALVFDWLPESAALRLDLRVMGASGEVLLDETQHADTIFRGDSVCEGRCQGGWEDVDRTSAVQPPDAGDASNDAADSGAATDASSGPDSSQSDAAPDA